jgi:hypothetical protein
LGRRGGNIRVFEMQQEALLPCSAECARAGATMNERAYVLGLSFERRHEIRIRRECALNCEEVVMVRIAIGVAILLVPVCAGLYVKFYRSREVISTTEWVRLMRKNDLRFDRATRARATKSRPS